MAVVVLGAVTYFEVGVVVEREKEEGPKFWR